MKLKFHNTEVHLDDDIPPFQKGIEPGWWNNGKCVLFLDEPPVQRRHHLHSLLTVQITKRRHHLHSLLKYRNLLTVPGTSYTQHTHDGAVWGVQIFDDETGKAIGLIMT